MTRILEQRRGAVLALDQVRQIRAVMVLERIGSGEAKDLLKQWAGRPRGSTVDDGNGGRFEAAGRRGESEPVEQPGHFDKPPALRSPDAADGRGKHAPCLTAASPSPRRSSWHD